ncbi:hypothetical protein R3P38DRAFT_3259363 [Favolaschia claudopus]|uniref:Uncharacterized protein n=1 Tax=Favolaschia claudopus TaxID=2862362 RepID=A0AAW0CXL1_9AGAR
MPVSSFAHPSEAPRHRPGVVILGHCREREGREMSSSRTMPVETKLRRYADAYAIDAGSNRCGQQSKYPGRRGETRPLFPTSRPWSAVQASSPHEREKQLEDGTDGGRGSGMDLEDARHREGMRLEDVLLQMRFENRIGRREMASKAQVDDPLLANTGTVTIGMIVTTGTRDVAAASSGRGSDRRVDSRDTSAKERQHQGMKAYMDE